MSSAENGFFSELVNELRDIWRATGHSLASSGVALRNQWRRIRQYDVDFVVIPLGGPLPERSGPPRGFIQRQLPLPPEPMSMEVLNHRLSAISDAGNVKGVLFIFQGISAGIASLQSLRTAIQRLRDKGKQVIVYTPYLDLPHYFVATAADRIVSPPSSSFEVLGIRSEAIFLKDALGKVGIEADVIQISPYKSAYDTFGRSEISPEQKEQIDWLLDETFDLLTSAIAEGRNKSQEEIKTLIDSSPLLPEQAMAAGLVDDLAYEDSLPILLASGAHEGQDRKSSQPAVKEESRENQPKATLTTWSRARERLMEKSRRPTRKYIGVVSLEGDIVMGPSRQPPINLPIPVPFAGSPASGEETLLAQLRRAERDSNMAALILHIDSGGGSSLASDLIWRQIHRIGQKKPVLAYMGNIAASGGYYVCVPAQHIMAQPTTITGSIGVITLHLSTGRLYDKLGVNRVNINRGERANLYSDEAPLTDQERQILWDGITDTYVKFKQVVADGRKLSLEELDPICDGRVWTGSQARQHKLIDSYGDFVCAIHKTAELAGLPTDDEHRLVVINIYSRTRDYVLPRPFEPAEEFVRLFSFENLRQMSGRPLLLIPFEIRFW